MTIFLPIITTLAGSALLAEDWEKIGVQVVSLSLDALLVKPGLTLLTQLPSLGAYVGWDKDIVLNATHLKANAAGVYQVRSTFDGRVLSYTEAELLALVKQLNPARIILPTARWYAALSTTSIHCFVPKQEQPLAQTVGEWSRQDAHTLLLTHEATAWIETEKPMLDAMQGLIYAENGAVLDISQPDLAYRFEPLSHTCACEACEKKLTFSYFHHLFQHTPGLCQRFFIQHNAWIRLTQNLEVEAKTADCDRAQYK